MDGLIFALVGSKCSRLCSDWIDTDRSAVRVHIFQVRQAISVCHNSHKATTAFFFKQLNTALVFISLPLSVYVCASCLCVVRRVTERNMTHASLIALLS